MASWRPLSSRADPTVTKFNALHEGVPVWLQSSLLQWVTRFLTSPPYPHPQASPNAGRIHMVQRRLRVQGLDWASSHHVLASFRTCCQDDPELFLNVVDLLAHSVGDSLNRPAESEKALKELADILDEGGSVWRLAELPTGGPGLERRVDETVGTVAREVMQWSGRAGEHLGADWTAAYGRQPQPSEAYREAVRAG